MLLWSAVSGACASAPDEAFVVEPVVRGLDRPTQLAVTDEWWYVAQLNGGEAAAVGQVLRIDPRSSAVPEVIVDGLDVPTGVAVFSGELWIMERRRLTRGPLDGGRRTVVVAEMAFNGRSQGTLTVDGDRLLFDTSGTTGSPPGPAGTPTDTSGAIWSVDLDGSITNLAWGFKHAYAHVRDDTEVLWTTEISDGRYDGEPPLDEIVAGGPAWITVGRSASTIAARFGNPGSPNRAPACRHLDLRYRCDTDRDRGGAVGPGAGGRPLGRGAGRLRRRRAPPTWCS